MGSIQRPREVDVLIIGGGFGGFSQWKRIKDLNIGLTVKIYEKAPESGGIWYWNCYPGARVDSDFPAYQLFDKELWSTFTFSERFPGGPELREYFKHVEKTWNITPDIEYNKTVTGAAWISTQHFWKVLCEDGTVTYCKWLLSCLGLGSTTNMPSFPGMEKFKGEVFHTARWPQGGVGLKGKRVAVVGTGASGVQVIQEIGDEVDHLTIYQRTPNLCMPMSQRKLYPQEEEVKKKMGKYENSFDTCRVSFAGNEDYAILRSGMDDTPEQRKELFDRLWVYGGFTFWQGSYYDLLTNLETNNEVYKYWRSRVLERIKDPKKQELLAPEKAPHPWGTKRPSLEQRYYEVVDQDHIDIIDISASPIVSFGERGLITKEEGEVPVDIIILATGFDSTLSISALNIVGIDGETIQDHWRNGPRSSMGIAIPGFPNLFYLYGTQAPSAFSNGPSLNQLQAEWVAETIKACEKEGVTSFEARKEMEDQWIELLQSEWSKTLFTKAKSWYNGSNIPGKKVEGKFWIGGIPTYMEWLKKSNENDHQGWIKQKRVLKM
ncbi:FAD/NAD(P)-binding domain-containing protein [Terfezia boudieri ATCC MYA-4762]|uniref:FAD/NAD(P)-binding domain-containing protein n=1 Tax=Terfezia boudieri ATCC MYA-4762 TaxID=1051890 RepID=A0A3N4LC26_9PEZI|nr:FAD/NAD(P)-binding domain-containing protein [Terfezia boudieri ATCC MYA-4762]